MKCLFPMEKYTLTQGFGSDSYSHQNSYAIDIIGDNGIKDYLYSPCDMKVVHIYEPDGLVYFQSLEKVEWTDGGLDYCVIAMAHCDYLNEFGIVKGKIFKQGEKCFREGSKGKVTGIHCHLEVLKGSWSERVKVDPRTLLYLKKGTEVFKNEYRGKIYDFLTLPDEVVEENNEENISEDNKNNENGDSPITYVVKSGDSLSKIAKVYNTTWNKIYQDNKELIVNQAKNHGVTKLYQNYIYPGQELIINV